MATFDFIVGTAFRDGLESDYSELVNVMGAAAWKSAHVLAGSIIEAVLVDYLVAKGDKGTDPLKIDLAAAIEQCKKDGVLSERTAALSHVVRDYRNLIHPGRAIRIGESVDAESAQVAKALVDMIVRDVAATREEEFGLTAEQLCRKLEVDASAVSIVPHLLDGLREEELNRLLLDVLPDRYLSAMEWHGPQEALPQALQACYRQGVEKADEATKKAAAKKLASVVRNEPEETVSIYERAFFRGGDLQHMDKKDRAIVKEHIISQVEKGRPIELLIGLLGAAPHLEEEELSRVAHEAAKLLILKGSTPEQGNAARDLIGDLYESGPIGKDTVISKLDGWIKFLRARSREAEATELEALKENLEIPF